jgi:hypothetical protein
MSISADPSHQQGQRVKGKALLANMFAKVVEPSLGAASLLSK